MSRSGYDDNYGDDNPWGLIRYRGAVASATRGARGQKLLRDMLNALDQLPEKKLIAHELEEPSGAVCALGAVGKARGLDMRGLDPYDPDTIAGTFGIATALAREVAFENDECGPRNETPEHRFERVRRWVVSQIKESADTKGGDNG